MLYATIRQPVASSHILFCCMGYGMGRPRALYFLRYRHDMAGFFCWLFCLVYTISYCSASKTYRHARISATPHAATRAAGTVRLAVYLLLPDDARWEREDCHFCRHRPLPHLLRYTRAAARPTPRRACALRLLRTAQRA